MPKEKTEKPDKLRFPGITVAVIILLALVVAGGSLVYEKAASLEPTPVMPSVVVPKPVVQQPAVSEPAAPTPTPVAPATPAQNLVYVNADFGLKLRSTPNSNNESNVLVLMPYKAEIVLLQNVDNIWYKGTYNGQTGFFAKEGVTKTKP